MADSSDIKRIDIAEFRERGYLQEVNRLMLHPLGLALEVVIDDCPECEGAGEIRGDQDSLVSGGLRLCLNPDCRDGKVEALGGVWDYRDDPEGIIFGAGEIDPEKVDRVAAEQQAKVPARERLLGRGNFIQTPVREFGSS